MKDDFRHSCFDSMMKWGNTRYHANWKVIHMQTITVLSPQQHAAPPRLPCSLRRWRLIRAFSLRCLVGSYRCQGRQAELRRSLRALLALQCAYQWENNTCMRMSSRRSEKQEHSWSVQTTRRQRQNIETTTRGKKPKQVETYSGEACPSSSSVVSLLMSALWPMR